MKLFYTPGACSLAAHIVLEELELTYELEKVDLAAKKTESGEDYLAINSKGYVPALLLDDGHLLTEVEVIMLYLSDQKPEVGLAPARGDSRYDLLSLLTFIASELHKPMGSFFNPIDSQEWRERTLAKLTERLDWISQTLGMKSYLRGERFTIADAYLFTILSWSKPAGISLDKWPTLQAFMERVAERPAARRALHSEGLR